MSKKLLIVSGSIIIVVLITMISSRILFGTFFSIFLGLRQYPPISTLHSNWVKFNCRGTNKKFERLGFVHGPVCVDIYADGGKPCKDGSECQSGKCVTRGDVNNFYCKKDSTLLCFAGEVEVNEGKPEGQIVTFGDKQVVQRLFCD